MDALLRALLLGGLIVLAFMVITRPRQLRQIGRKARLVGLIYVGVIVVSGLLRLACLNAWIAEDTCRVFG
ncbi:MAG: hypothetical protein WD734_02560 [Dehalococcoidia bacterium]